MSPTRLILLLLVLLSVSAGGIVVLTTARPGASASVETQIQETVDAEREAARTGDLGRFLQYQDSTAPGWREHQRTVFERDRLINSRLGEVKAVSLDGNLARATIYLEGAKGRWVVGALYRRVRGQWLRSTPSAAERGKALRFRADGFDIQYDGWDEGQVAWFQDSLKQARRIVEGTLGEVQGSARVRLHSSPQTLPRASFNSNAYYDSRQDRIEVLSPYYWPRSEDEEALTATLVHEYVHLAVDRMAGDEVPRWLDEGLAMVISGEWNQVTQQVLEGYIARGQVVPFEELAEVFSSTDPTRAYVTSAGLTAYLVRQHGMHVLKDVLVEIGNGTKPDAALMRAVGADSVTLYDAWSREIHKSPR